MAFRRWHQVNTKSPSLNFCCNVWELLKHGCDFLLPIAHLSKPPFRIKLSTQPANQNRRFAPRALKTAAILSGVVLVQNII